MISSKGCNKIF